MTSRKAGYAYIWEYIARADRLAEFEHAYGPDGDWVTPFRRAPGYVHTELLRDRRHPCRFVTVDYWESADDWESFRASLSQEFDTIDGRCVELTLEEREVGVFDPIC